jgi:hypothetical protein
MFNLGVLRHERRDIQGKGCFPSGRRVGRARPHNAGARSFG